MRDLDVRLRGAGLGELRTYRVLGRRLTRPIRPARDAPTLQVGAVGGPAIAVRVAVQYADRRHLGGLRPGYPRGDARDGPAKPPGVHKLLVGAVCCTGVARNDDIPDVSRQTPSLASRRLRGLARNDEIRDVLRQTPCTTHGQAAPPGGCQPVACPAPLGGRSRHEQVIFHAGVPARSRSDRAGTRRRMKAKHRLSESGHGCADSRHSSPRSGSSATSRSPCRCSSAS